ncbi:conserved hypothetical protein [Candidatus Desulfosporosinus infrequens]|uniref:Uncharacterized protein n=1 Tax=Candidatus Desulfosporosinus infrequens TaxID=2043169 RepID=A0A2U3LTN5_9FIRM|nr:conserved hypothetical protein [Candidatus Desulfosporosinus infrequens]
MDDDYIFRRELDLQTNLPEMIDHIIYDRPFRKMDNNKKKELIDEYYKFAKNNFLSEGPSDEEKRTIQNAAMKEILERARQEVRNTMH